MELDLTVIVPLLPSLVASSLALDVRYLFFFFFFFLNAPAFLLLVVVGGYLAVCCDFGVCVRRNHSRSFSLPSCLLYLTTNVHIL